MLNLIISIKIDYNLYSDKNQPSSGPKNFYAKKSNSRYRDKREAKKKKCLNTEEDILVEPQKCLFHSNDIESKLVTF